jgi:hypothetical protein
LLEIGERCVDLCPFRQLGDEERVLSSELIVPAAPVKAVLLDGIDPGSVHDHDQVDADALSGAFGALVGSVAHAGRVVGRRGRTPASLSVIVVRFRGRYALLTGR